jgi:hypothetical protein
MQVIHQEADLTFQPKISEKTQVLAEKKNEGLNVYDRLTLEQQQIQQNEQFQEENTFQPAINPISDELDNRMKMT